MLCHLTLPEVGPVVLIIVAAIMAGAMILRTWHRG
jgi:hypothetical protein